MSASDRPAHQPPFRLNREGEGFARNRSITMPHVMWEDTDEAARMATEDAGYVIKFSEWGRRTLAKELHRLGFEGYSEDGTQYPADRKPQSWD